MTAEREWVWLAAELGSDRAPRVRRLVYQEERPDLGIVVLTDARGREYHVAPDEVHATEAAARRAIAAPVYRRKRARAKGAR